MNRFDNENALANRSTFAMGSAGRLLDGELTIRWKPALVLLALLLANWQASAAEDSSTALSLAGEWRFQLDRNDVGIEQTWFARPLRATVQLPGALPAQGIGDDVTTATKWMGEIKRDKWYDDPQYKKYATPNDFRFPFWLQPDKYYAGAAWYQRDLEVPGDWQGKRLVLTLERPHWETRVWVDGKSVGSNDSLSTPHVYDLGTALAPGRHQLTIRVDNSLVVDIGVNSHSIADHTQGNWNGIVGELKLATTSPVWIANLQVYPDVKSKRVLVRTQVANTTGKPSAGTLSLSIETVGGKELNQISSHSREITVPIAGSSPEIEIPLGDEAQLWDEFSPTLYRLRAHWKGGDGEQSEDQRKVTFGLREISTAGTQFLINGRKTFFRGTLECAVFPATGHPPTDVEEWKRVVRVCKAHGLNMIRFHSWCPPEAAFDAADELGFYYQVEAASWANASTTIGDGKPVDNWVKRETDRILRAYGNHPSFVLMAYGNEPGGTNQKIYLAEWVKEYRQQDPRRLYTSGAGWPQIGENQFHVAPDPRIQAWGEGLKSRINAKPPETRTDYRAYIRQRRVPVISHEIGQWCVYPNFDEISKYTGYLKPKNFEIFRDSLSAHEMAIKPMIFSSRRENCRRFVTRKMSNPPCERPVWEAFSFWG